ncbi:MAG: glycosyltransferase family 2 protein [Acidobacteriota bacterium]
MYKNFLVAVVMPIHNEAQQIERAIARIPDFVDYIFAVDDGSSDATWQKLYSIGDPRLQRLRHEKNLGVGAATKTGYRQALKSDADFVAVMDGDGQMAGEDLSVLLDAAIEGADFVKGNRFLSQTIKRMPLGRWIGNCSFSFLTRHAVSFSEKIDAQCGFTVIRRRALDCLNIEGLFNRYGFPNEMFFEAHRQGLKIANVPVQTIYGDEVSGINPFKVVPIIGWLIARNYLRRKWSILTTGWAASAKRPLRRFLKAEPINE